MQKYFNNVADSQGNAIAGASVTVTTSAGLLATIYSNNASTPQANPITTDQNGYFAFYAADGRYNLTISGARINPSIVITDVLLEDPADNQIYAQVSDYAGLRVYTGTLTTVYVTGYPITPAPSGIAGQFVYDPADTTSADNGCTIIVAANGKRWKRADAGFINLRWFDTVDNTGVADSRAGIQSAINVSSTLGKFLYVPAGTYKLTKGSVQTAESGSVYPCLTIMSNMHIMAEPGAIFKLADNQSSNAAPFNIGMFFSNSVLHDISIHDLTIDLNAANNKINNNNFTFAHFMFSGTPSGVAASATNVYLSGCKFINNPGATCVGMAQTETVGATLGKNWTIRDCLFENNGLDCGDHSSVYALADDVLCTGNTFTADTMAVDGGTGGQCAYEFHGADQRFTHNKVKNYYQGVWVAANKTSACENNIIAINDFSQVSDYGVAFYRESASETAINNIEIIANIVNITDRSTSASFKAAVAITSTYPVSNVLITKNIAKKTGTSEASAFCLISQQGVVTSTPHTGIKIHGNSGSGLTEGVFMTTGAMGLGRISIKNNDFEDFVVAGAETETRGVYLERLSGTAVVDELVLSGNNFSNSTNSMTYGIRLQSGVITHLSMGADNTYRNVTNKYVENVTVTTRSGWFPSKSYTPIINIGGVVTIGNGTVDGSYVYENGMVTAFARYIVGSTDTIPGGNINVGVPIASINAGQIYMGEWRINDVSASLNYFDIAQIDGTGSLASFRINGGVIATSASPVPLAAGDTLNLQITYKAA